MNTQAQTLPQQDFQDTNSEAPAAVPRPAAQTALPKKAASAFRTISEVADELQVQQHVLRFWETKFSHIRPLKRGGGRRYYRPEDVDLLKTIHTLLYGEGYTIKGVQKLLREKGKNQVVEKTAPPPAAGNANQQASAAKPGLTERQRLALQGIAGDLRDLRTLIDNDG